jgi:hypothetical protein
VNVPDNLTVIRARGRRLAKLIRADGSVEGYDDAKHFDLFAIPVSDLEAVHRLLNRLLHRPDCAIVRGTIADPRRVSHVRRLLHPDPQTGDAATLRAVPRMWLAADVEGLERPVGTPAADLLACAAAAVVRLPGPFRGARCIVQASASHGIRPDLRLRLWFWLSRPATGEELKRWLRGAPADPSVFSPAQIIYTAAPVFERGAADPLPQRTAVREGFAVVEVPSAEALNPPPRPPAPLPQPSDRRANRYAWTALRNATSRILQANVGQRHAAALAEARQLARFVQAGLLSECEVSEAVSGAGAAAGKPPEEISSVITWAFAHPSDKPLPDGVVR